MSSDDANQPCTSSMVTSDSSPNIPASSLLLPTAHQPIWDEWMCMLAGALTPDQWNAYWQVYVGMFGVDALPPHLGLFDALCRAAAVEGWLVLNVKFLCFSNFKYLLNVFNSNFYITGFFLFFKVQIFVERFNSNFLYHWNFFCLLNLGILILQANNVK
jgi:hypothetical protein